MYPVAGFGPQPEQPSMQQGLQIEAYFLPLLNGGEFEPALGFFLQEPNDP
jgi:hypothetical protein